ncbi:hypothetical protein E4T56_gene9433, partial [Termitomyces sp. T112]
LINQGAVRNADRFRDIGLLQPLCLSELQKTRADAHPAPVHDSALTKLTNMSYSNNFMQLLTLPKLAAQSGWPEPRIRRMVARKQLAHIRVNGRLMLPETAIDDYVAKYFVEANGADPTQPIGA